MILLLTSPPPPETTILQDETLTTRFSHLSGNSYKSDDLSQISCSLLKIFPLFSDRIDHLELPGSSSNHTSIIIFMYCSYMCIHAKSLQLCVPASSVRGILQARILEWVAVPSSRGPSPPRDWIWISSVSCIGRWVLYHQHFLGSLFAVTVL